VSASRNTLGTLTKPAGLNAWSIPSAREIAHVCGINAEILAPERAARTRAAMSSTTSLCARAPKDSPEIPSHSVDQLRLVSFPRS